MIKVAASKVNRIVNVHVKGRLSALEFGEAGQSFAKKFVRHKRLHVLIDWTALEGWDDDDAVTGACRQWRNVGPVIERAAIIHHHCWNRQAAVMAAVLRTERVYVRSWATADYAKAVAWLNES